MARFFTLTTSKQGTAGFDRRRTINLRSGAGPVSLRFLTIAILAVLSLLYLIQANSSATKGYAVKALEEERAKLESQNDRLKVEASRQKSIAEIENKTQDLGMVPVDKVEYE